MQAKNVKHSGLFFVRSVHSLFDYNGGWKTGARGDKRAVDEVNEAIRAINREHQAENVKIARQNQDIRRENRKIRAANREIRQLNQLARKACPKGEEFLELPQMAEAEEIPLKKIYREFGARTNPARPRDILDRTLLFRVVHDHQDQDGVNVWASLPAVVAQQALIEVIEAFTGYIEAMKLYRRAPEEFTGRPQWPDYGEKRQPIPFTFTGRA